MDNLERFAAQTRNHLLFVIILSNLLVIGGFWFGGSVIGLDNPWLILLTVGGAVALAVTLASFSAGHLTRPMRTISQAILHIAPDAANVPAPEVKSNMLGAELIGNLVSHVYQLASVVEKVEQTAGRKSHNLQTDFIANSLPLPLFILDKQQNIVFANQKASEYLSKPTDEMAGQSLYTVLDMSFSSKNTFDVWLRNAKATKPVATQTWERVRLSLSNQKTTPQFDLAAYYNRSNPEGLETILVLFDHTLRYSEDDQALGFVALAVHELRTPVTLLRGYIEAFEEELANKLSPELTNFMHKMQASSQNLSTFINNILNVARIENNQLTLKLHEEQWSDIVTNAVEDMRLRAAVRGIEIKTEIAPNLPTVGVDRVSIYEVINNLIDNAIKYSGSSKQILVKSYIAQNGMIETTVQDFGVGIASSVLPNLFDKFYRSHRSRAQIGGTGLGLYLSKTIVEAHGGEVWVQSKEGQGSVFGFTVLPFTQLAEAERSGDNKDIVRSAHGWIKNHSLYRG